MADYLDIDALRALAVVASELNMRRAADLLNISQPPLSRKIKSLEKRLGTALFVRRSWGLELTERGREILGIIRPLLDMQEDVQRRLDALKPSEPSVIGFTTAFEQGIYAPVISAVKSICGPGVAVKRASSIQLAHDVLKGDILLAWVALPLDMPGLTTLPVPYSEPLLAVFPDNWNISGDAIDLSGMIGRPFFWFAACRNPYWHGRMCAVFRRVAFKPDCIEEPLEYEVLLARIASGEGWALIPKSLGAIRREGISFATVQDLPSLEMGMAYCSEAGEKLAFECVGVLRPH